MDNNEIFDSPGAEDGVEVVDLDGEPFAIIGELEHKGATYLALIPYEEDEDEDEDSDLEFVILKESEEDGEHFLATIDDDKFYEEIGEMFLKMFAEMQEE
ncbi:MAG: DUF1292 domain-containing protein [Oscillospiraceae bacterium]|nr:DUF1292 domain-containing protein [Oscillospiraceae bacterium]